MGVVCKVVSRVVRGVVHRAGGQWVVHRAGVSLFNSPVSAFLHGGKVTFLDRPPLQEGPQWVRMGGGGGWKRVCK